MLNKINTKNQNLSKIVAWCCGLGIMLWSILLTKKFINFGYYDWDLAIYAQAMWRMIHGSLNVSLFGMNFLGNHAEYVSFFIAPIYFLFPHPLTLLFLKIISFFTAAYILFHIAKKYLPGAIAFVIFLLYIFYPANIFMLVFEFHFESLALPLLMGILWAFLEKKIKIFLILSFFLCLVKENMPLIVIMFGVCSLFRKETHKWLWGGIPILFGMIYFLVTLFYLIPLSRAGLPSTEHIYWGLFGHLSSTPLGIIKKLLLEPTFFLQQIITKQNIQYMQSLFTPLAYLPFLKPSVLALSIPFFLQNILSNAWQQHTIYFHYAASIAPFIFTAFIFTLKKFSHRIMKILLFFCITLTFLSLTFYAESLSYRLTTNPDKTAFIKAKIVSQIPKDAGVIASFPFLSHLSDREHLYAFFDLWKGIKILAGYPFQMPETVQYALIDIEDPWLLADLRLLDPISRAKIKERINNNFLNGDWHIISSHKTIYLLKRNKEKRGVTQWK